MLCCFSKFAKWNWWLVREFGIFFIVLLYFGSFKGAGEEEVEGREVGKVSWCLVAGEICL